MKKKIIIIDNSNLSYSGEDINGLTLRGTETSLILLAEQFIRTGIEVHFCNNIVETKLLGKMRGQQLARLSVAPFQYNPTTNQLKIITKLEVRIIFKNIDVDRHKLNKEKEEYANELTYLSNYPEQGQLFSG